MTALNVYNELARYNRINIDNDLNLKFINDNASLFNYISLKISGTRLSLKTFKFYKNVRTIKLTTNNWTCMPKIKNLHNLRYLKITCNNLTATNKIPKNIRKLQLSYNLISKIENLNRQLKLQHNFYNRQYYSLNSIKGLIFGK